MKRFASLLAVILALSLKLMAGAPAYKLAYNRSTGEFMLVAPQFKNEQQVLNAVFDGVHGGLVLSFVSGTPSPSAQFLGTDQIFNKIYDSARGALTVNCVHGCAADPPLNDIQNPTGDTTLDVGGHNIVFNNVSSNVGSGFVVNLNDLAATSTSFNVNTANFLGNPFIVVAERSASDGNTPTSTNYNEIAAAGSFLVFEDGGNTIQFEVVPPRGAAAGHVSSILPIDAKRYKATGTALVAGDFALTGWGTGAAIASITGNDQWWQGTVTAGTTPSANPTVQLTYHDLTWTNAPIPICVENGTTDVFSTITASSSATVLTVTYNATPVNTKTYTLACHVGGF